MLVQTHDPEKVIAAVAEEPAHAFILRYWMESLNREAQQPAGFLLTDSPDDPTLLVLQSGAQIFALARRLEGYKRIAEDLLHERIRQTPPWPDEAAAGAWKHWLLGKGLFVNSSPLVLWEFMLAAGFESLGEEHAHHAYLWVVEGEPRFSRLVKHPCRVGEGEELWDELRRGIHYDPEGEYVRSCVRRGPSFVCEVGGEKVCWSATHLNGTMAMIYTPPEHRRKGYAKSLAAFQLDYMLREYGLACAHVVSTNIESRNLMESLGARRIHEPCVWRVLYYPGEAEKARLREQERKASQ